MPEIGGYVALVFVLIEVVLLVFLALGKMPKPAFLAASLPVFFFAAFFWLDNRVTEITLPSLGTIKTAANLATQYVEEIKNIKTDIERQKQQITTAVDTFNKEIDGARAELQKIKGRISPRKVTDEQKQAIVDKVRQFEGQYSGIITAWYNSECASFADGLIQTLKLANWDARRSGEGLRNSRGEQRSLLPLPQNGIVIVGVNSPPERTQNAAKALVDALNEANIQAQEQYVQTKESHDGMSILIGTRPDFPESPWQP